MAWCKKICVSIPFYSGRLFLQQKKPDSQKKKFGSFFNPFLFRSIISTKWIWRCLIFYEKLVSIPFYSGQLFLQESPILKARNGQFGFNPFLFRSVISNGGPNPHKCLTLFEFQSLFLQVNYLYGSSNKRKCLGNIISIPFYSGQLFLQVLGLVELILTNA